MRLVHRNASQHFLQEGGHRGSDKELESRPSLGASWGLEIVIRGRIGAGIRQVSLGGGSLGKRESTLAGSLLAGPVPVRHPELVCSLQVLLPLRLVVPASRFRTPLP